MFPQIAQPENRVGLHNGADRLGEAVRSGTEKCRHSSASHFVQLQVGGNAVSGKRYGWIRNTVLPV